jgi:hypothetical protein
MNNIYIINNIYNNEIKLNFINNTFILNNNHYKFEFISKDSIQIYWNIDTFEIFISNDSYLYFVDITLRNTVKKIFLIHNEWYDQAIIILKKNRINLSEDLSIVSRIFFRENTEINSNANECLVPFLEMPMKENTEINSNANECLVPFSEMPMKENTLFRIKSKEQYGNIELNENKLIIKWNHWGYETYIKYDNYTYIQENKYNMINKINYKQYIPIHIFIHICCIGDNWKDIFIEQIELIKKTGLYNITTKIHLGILGNINNINDKIFNDIKFDIEYIDKKIIIYEINTINSIKNFCENNKEDEIYILYIHTKGVRKAGNEEVIKSWRNMMQYFLIEKYIDCIKNLHIYDTLGCNIVNEHCVKNDDSSINKNHNYHYSGNFWWSKKTYINKLCYLPVDLTINSINTRYKAENWILSNIPDANVGILFQDDTNTHPYHRYIFNYYREMKFLIKDLIK